MAEYVYEGPGPVEHPEAGLVRPGGRREFDAEPDWGPWRKADPPRGAESDSAPPATPAPAPAPVSPPAASAPPPAPAPAAKPEGM